VKRLAVLSLAVLLAGAVLWACGPFLPNVILGSDERMFNGPTGMFASELAHLERGAPSFEALPPPDDDPAAQTLQVDLAEVAEILASPGTPPDSRQTTLDALAALRDGLYRTDGVNAGSVEGPAPDPATLKVPGGLPPELALYLKGAVAWHLGDLSEAEDAWNQVLGLPETQRRHRSTWAAFMLGRLAGDDDPEEAARCFQLTRELASKGFADSLGLAASSLGWEALAEIHQGHPDKALVLYQRQSEAGDTTAFNSLSITSSNLLASDEPEALDRVARDPEARSLLTAYVISRASWDAERWLKALKAAGVQDQDGTDRLAWAAYLAGDFEQAAAWLDRAPESSPMARWIRARLLLRDGKLDEARELLAGVARELPKTGMTLDEAFWFASSEEVIAAPERAAGEEATLRLIRNDFNGALEEFLHAGYWMDAAYLAEQVLSADELKAYVDANAPADPAAKQEPPSEDEWEPMLAGGYTSPPPERLVRDLRYLLGRRLAREGRRSEAEVYLTGEPRAALESLSAHLSAGRDARRPRSGRAAELFDAACLLRYQGMEVTGTEVEPDWTLFEGSYDPSWYVGDRLERRKNQFIPMSPEEAARIEKNRTEPRRFHYRYRAADLAWEAAKLLPGGDRKAEMLATAGNWIKYAEPETADRFYKELVRCCRTTDLGQEADDLRWFPEADACSAQGDPE
jgi:tetratricopeptide (TPR) repeat protein